MSEQQTDPNIDFNNMNKTALLAKCAELGITKCKSKTRSELINLIKTKLASPSSQSNPNNEFVQQPPNTLNFIEVCAGAGGLSSGLMKAGLFPLLLNDFNKDCCETLKLNHPGINIIHSPMEKIDYTPYIGRVDILTGGVPCQAFSQAGERLGLNDPRGALMYRFAEILNTVKPKLFMIENVKGLLSHDNGNTMRTIIETLNASGLYNITYKCLDASKYGVPQKRERIFIIGILKTITQTPFVFPTELTTRPVVRDALANVPTSIGAKYPAEKIRLFQMIPQGGCWINLPVAEQIQYLGNSYNSGGGKRGILHRLSMDKPSLTLLCTPSQKQTERCHPIENRPLTVREYARIQTFDDTHQFVGSLSSQYKQIGNAVPVELARQMGLAIKKNLELASQPN